MREDEKIRRFAKRIDTALDNGHRAGLLWENPRFCVSDTGAFFLSLSDDSQHWGTTSVSEKSLETYKAGWGYDWFDRPQSLRQVLSKTPSAVALEIAKALVAQNNGHGR